VKAELESILVTIRKSAEEEWPSAYEQRALADDIEREFEVVDSAGPYASGTWSFILRERNQRAVVRRINELIREHTGG
jgi:hypothetical protein